MSSVVNQAWLRALPTKVPAGLANPMEMAAFELKSALPDLPVELHEDPALGDGFSL